MCVYVNAICLSLCNALIVRALIHPQIGGIMWVRPLWYEYRDVPLGKFMSDSKCEDVTNSIIGMVDDTVDLPMMQSKETEV